MDYYSFFFLSLCPLRSIYLCRGSVQKGPLVVTARLDLSIKSTVVAIWIKKSLKAKRISWLEQSLYVDRQMHLLDYQSYYFGLSPPGYPRAVSESYLFEMRNKYQSSCEHSEAFLFDRHQNPLHAILAGFQRPEGRDAGILVRSGSKIHLKYVNKVKTKYEYLNNF